MADKEENIKKKDQPNLEQNKKEEPMSVMGKSIVTGFAGGVFWSAIAYLAYILNFTEISPNLILQPFTLGDWKDGVLGNIISIIIIGLISVGAALVYYAILKRFDGMWLGILYGGALWGLVFFILNPIFPNVETVFELSRATIVTTLCLYILYGVFIGYSISFDYKEFNTKLES
ncbi:hypothetical protein CJ195_06600 [Bacillus sp. UMB0899]|uniref:YqhR family membrane protein n=1 Tax=Metabacillus schmidteae TaxID=2730405 RepID=UPI000C80C5B0|nr:YqhR family membrane protein [Metabacillus schmidteae]PMC39582.1 hypothetical protein CJ195_06600 [Bacillus sp. UMB0899]